MGVAVDQPGDEHPPAGIQSIVADFQFRLGGALPQQRQHPPVVADVKAGKALQAAPLVERIAVGVDDQRLCRGFAGNKQQQRRQQRADQTSLRISELVSSRLPPMRCTSA